MIRYRKGELNFYKSSLPKELKDYVKNNPENKEYINNFLETYRYNYVSEKWVKK